MFEKDTGRAIHAPRQPSGEDLPWTIRRLLNWTTGYFQRAGLPSPRLDAEVLLAHVLQQDRLDLYLQYEEPVGETDRTTYRHLVQQRSKAVPVAYLTGHREFYSLSLAVSPSVLIPRPETEHLIDIALRFFRARSADAGKGGIRILDVGTGSGNIPLALAAHLPDARITSVDISARALAVARTNLKAHADLSARICLVRGDLLTAFRKGISGFQAILSNPPYVSAADWENLPPDVREHEPRLALLAGPTGMERLEQLLHAAPPLLAEDGMLLLEVGEDQATSLQRRAEQQEGIREARIFPDYAGKPRVLAASRRTLAA